MAKKIRKSKKNTSIKKTQDGILRRIIFTESYTSLILGAIAVLIIGILFVFFAKGNKNSQTSSTFDKEIEIAKEIYENSKTSSTYTINPGDSLWAISENIYNNGYRWIEIAKINNLQNPGIIYSGDKLILPTQAQDKEFTASKAASIQTSQVSNEVIKNVSISGSNYTVVKGDNLWNIAVRAYGDGFRWPDIAKANNLENPSLIFSDNVLKIPR